MIILLLALAAANPTQTDIIAHFKAGKLLCSNPDATSKTCSTIDRVSLNDAGAMIDTGETLIEPDKPITLEIASRMNMEGGAMCGLMSMDDLSKGIVRANGTPIPAERNAMVLDKLKQVFQPLAGQKVCEGLSVRDGQLIMLGQAERFNLPLRDKSVQWISPQDGYRVAPRP